MPLINGTAGNDSIDSTGVNGAGQGTTSGADTVHGFAGDDTIVAGGGADVVYGGDGFDILFGQAGNDTLYGGTETLGGFESGPAEGWRGARAVYSGSAGAITVVFDTVATVTGGADIGTDTLVNVQQVRGSNFADSFTATANYSGMFGNFAEFEGMDGNDVINGNGNTRANYQSATAAVTVNLTAGTATSSAGGNAAGIGTDTLINVNSVRGSNFGDTLSAANNGNFLVFIGGGGNDTITGSLINTPFVGGSEARYDGATEAIVAVLDVNSSVVGGASTGTDELHAIDRIRGSNFNDQYTATANFVGGAGTFNQFEGMDGDDIINGNGNTRIAYAQALSGVTVNFLTGTAFSTAGGDAAGIGVDTFTNVDNVRGSNYADTFTAAGAHGQFQFEGRAGNDTITGTGLAVNNLDFNVARYSFSTAGIQATLGAVSSVTGDASVGTDTLISVEAIRGSQFADTFTATGAFNGQFGAFNDFEGEGGNDTITGNGATRVSYASAFAGVTVSLLTGTGASSAGGDLAGVGVDTFTGVNSIRGSNFADILTGSNGAQAERFTGGAGNDTINGGGGTLDSADYRNSAAAVNVNLATGTAADGFGSTDTLSNIEGARGSEFGDILVGDGGANILQGQGGNDTISGGLGADLLIGDDDEGWGGVFGANVLFDVGNDVLSGDGGNDTLLGGAGQDILAGGSGNDSLDGGTNTVGFGDLASYASAAGAVNINLATGLASDGLGGIDTLINIEGLIGSTFGDTLTGRTVGNDILEGNAGNDILNGNGNTDATPFGDFAQYTNTATSGVVVNLTTGTASDGLGGTDTLIDIDGVNGSNFNDSITGNGDANLLRGMDGADTLAGGGGADSLEGGAGNDNMVGNQGNDTIVGGAGDDYAHGGADNDTLIGEDGNDRLDGALGNDVINGGAGFDILISNQGDDLIIGGADADYMHGGQNNDTLQGGDGDDVMLGGVGSDSIDGGAGYDGAAWTGLRSAFTVTNNGGGSWTVVHIATGDTDAVTGVEFLVFDDQVVS